MARVKLPIVVINSSTGLPVNGASVALSLRATGAPATWYSTETGGVGSTSALATDASGRVTAWLDRGAYNATISGSGITTYTEAIDAAAATDASVDSAWVDLNVLLPGEIRMYAGPTPPTGWLTCDGSIVSRTTYSRLFTAIGTAFGAGDGSTTFGLPDCRGRGPIGAGTGSGLTARSRGATGGTETHALTVGQIPEGIPTSTAGVFGSSYAGAVGGSNVPYIPPATGNWTTVKTGVDPSTIGGVTNTSNPHNNMQPFAVFNFIIKT